MTICLAETKLLITYFGYISAEHALAGRRVLNQKLLSLLLAIVVSNVKNNNRNTFFLQLFSYGAKMNEYVIGKLIVVIVYLNYD